MIIERAQSKIADVMASMPPEQVKAQADWEKTIQGFTGCGRILEIGGDLVKPNWHPNLNMVPGPGVDTIHDINDGLPFGNNEFDGVFGMFVLEHVRHARVRRFIAELYRVLKPGGQTIMVTANLLEQCRALVNAPECTDALVHMIFGGSPDYPGNYHHTGFSPQWASKLFGEAGFHDGKVFPWPQASTDMVIWARKP